MVASGDAEPAPDDLVSLCHGAPVRVAEDTARHWECTRCGEPCDVTTRAQDESWREQVEFGRVQEGGPDWPEPGVGC